MRACLFERLEQRRLLAAGALDLTFGAGGKVITDFTSATGGEARHAMVVQADGKIVAVGDTQDVGGLDFAVARFNADGSPDLSFGNGGTVTTDFQVTDSARGVAVQGDGKIVVVGYIQDTSSLFNFAVVRYNTDGSLDTSFGTGGAVFSWFGADSIANAVAIQSDGKIVVAGGETSVPASPGGGTNIAIARYNADGSADNTFDGDGRVSSFAPSFDANSFEAGALVIQADGKLVLAGMNDNKPMVARFDPFGAPDTGFGSGGYQLDPFSGLDGRAFGVAVQSDGKIVFGGTSGTVSTDVAIGRLNANGSIDSTFDLDGRVVTDLGSDFDVATGIALQADGKIVASASGDVDAGGGWRVLRYSTSGTPDTAFNAIAQLADGTANTVAIQADGKIITAGQASGAFQIARHQTNGALDLSFDVDGITTNTFLGSRNDTGRRIAIQQTDGKLVVVGQTLSDSGSADVAIARYDLDGSLDASFGNGGRVLSNFGLTETANAVAIQSDGKLVVAGQRGSDFLIARYNTYGTLDTSFDSDGWTTTDLAGGLDNALAIAIQADGKIIAAGQAVVTGTGNDFALARYNTNGSLDISFDGDGKLTTPFALGAAADIANAILIQPDGKIVAAGSTAQTVNDFALARYNADGSLDSAGFGTGGKVTTSFGAFSDVVNAIALQPDGRIITVGQAGTSTTTAVFGLARFTTAGALDSSFGTGGRATVNHTAGSSDIARGVVIQPNGKIIVAGSSGGNFALARVDAAGAPDATFGAAGQVTTDFGGNDSANSLVMQADGKFVAVGTIGRLDASGNDFALARYLGDNAAPTAVANGPYSVNEGGSVALSAAGSSDPDQSAATLTYAWDLDGDNVFGEVGESGMSPTFSAANLDGPSSVNVKLRVTDSVGASDTTTTQVNVNNVAPAVGTISAPASPQLVGATVNASASFGDAGTLDTHTAVWDWGDTNTSVGTVSESSGTGSVSGSHAYSTSGSYSVTLTVTDDDGAAGQSVFQYVIVNAAPTAVANGPYSVNEGGSVALSAAGSSDPDQSAATLTYAWDLDGDNVFGEAGETGAAPTFSAANVDGPSSVNVKLRVTDSVGASDTTNAQVNVNNAAPTVGAISAPTAPQLLGATVNASASFGDAGTLDTHTALWNWGDTTTSAGTISESNGSGTVNGSHVYGASGSYAVTLTVTDDDGASAQSVFQYVVINAAPTAVANGPYSVNEGGTVALSGTGSSDPDQSAATLTYAWDLDGDNVFGETGAGATRGNETGATPTFSSGNLDGPTSVNVKLRVTDSLGASDTTTAVVNVNNVAPTVGAISAPSTPQLTGATVNASASFGDVGTLDTHTAVWNWGDTTTSAGTVTESNGSGTVNGSHVYSLSGSYTVTLTVSDDDGASGQSVFQYVVVNAAPTAVANGPYTVSEGGTVALSSAGSSDPNQSATTLIYTWDLDGDNVFGETGVSAARGNETGATPTFAAGNLDGPTSVTVKLRVTDSFGVSANTTAQVNVTNVAPTIGAITAPIDPQRINTSVSASATFADAGTLDTHTAVWNWGDSTTSAGAVSETNGAGSVNGSHAYTAAGVYTVTLTVTDDNGGSSQQIFQSVVVYNPDGGFVAGGGTINSPAGAMPGNPTATGTALFAFVTGYRRGASVPTGETLFHFSVGNFSFLSTTLDWMVITGAKVRYRGTGKVNGGGNYGFQITAIDGNRPGGGGVDRFRIKIWNINAGNAVVYDNQLGTSDDADPVTAIRSGAIRIEIP